jgi:hypothetical protein
MWIDLDKDGSAKNALSFNGTGLYIETFIVFKMMTGTMLMFINYVQTKVDIEIKKLYCKYLQIYLK